MNKTNRTSPSNRTALFRDRLKDEVILFDGAFGTMLQAGGLPLGEAPERLNLTDPDRVLAIHEAYVRAGAEIVCANTFGANRKKLPADLSVAEVVKSAVGLAKRAAGASGTLVALDVGPIGELLEPMGSLSFDEACEIFRETMTAGEESGADLIAIETMTDLSEVRAAILTAKESTSLPVLCTMSFEENGRTFTGCDVQAFGLVASGLGADAIGINCSLGPAQILPIMKHLAQATDLPLVVKANAGLPRPDGTYSVSAEEFAAVSREFVELGVSVIGGCCGTTPEYIEKIAQSAKGTARKIRPEATVRGVCSASRIVPFDGVRVVGERINPTGKKLMKAALLEENMDYIAEQAISQIEAGAEILDVNVGLPGIDEVRMMKRAVSAVQAVCDAPVQIDSSNSAAIEAALRSYCGRALVNSVNGDDEVLEAVLPLVKKYGAAVVGLTLDKRGIPADAEARIAVAEKIVSHANGFGIPARDLVIDCLTLTVSAEQRQVAETLSAIRVMKSRGLLTTLGVSNVSFGLPRRELVNTAFLTLALGAGLDLPITNPNIDSNMDAIRAFRALSGRDEHCSDYVERYAGTATAVAVLGPGTPSNAGAAAASKRSSTEVGQARPSAGECIVKGLGEIAATVRALLEDRSPLEVVNDVLIPALDEVGRLYESGKIFLPQLIRSAETAKLGFDEVKKKIAVTGGNSAERGKIVLATVKGDVHDIGKNIVKVVLENYGYRIIDLGKNVPVATVVETVRREQVKLVGLSALMTTTVVSMKETIEALRAAGLSCTVMVGGAVLTEDYAKSIGADYYAKDANQSVRIAKEVLG